MALTIYDQQNNPDGAYQHYNNRDISSAVACVIMVGMVG
jgi:hypothetical protein